MKKKYQVFVSSTFTDLKKDRQVAVEAILKAGDIPAGMELFAADSESQLTVIKRWIDESDIFVLILGGRYGTVEPKSGKSYTQVEYEYAVSKKIPHFAIVMSDTCIKQRVKDYGMDVFETENKKYYDEFKKIVTSKMCKFYDDPKDIRINIGETLSDFHQRYDLSGWISGKGFNLDDYIKETRELRNEVKRLTQENLKLKAESETFRDKKNLFISDDFGTRIERLLNLLNFSEQGNPVEWEEDNDEFSMVNKTDSFEPYFVKLKKDTEEFEDISFVYTNDEGTINLSGLLSEIRLQLEEIPNRKFDCRIRFIIASDKIDEEIKKSCMKNFTTMLEKSSIPSELHTQIVLEIWNNNVVKTMEKEHGLFSDDLEFNEEG